MKALWAAELRAVTPTGETRTAQGKYLNVGRRGTDGSWRVIVDMGNQGTP